MNETAIPVAEAAKDFLKLLDLVERKQESAIFMREGRAVATRNPMPGPELPSVELADRWEKWTSFPRMKPRPLPPLKSAWD